VINDCNTVINDDSLLCRVVFHATTNEMGGARGTEIDCTPTPEQNYQGGHVGGGVELRVVWGVVSVNRLVSHVARSLHALVLQPFRLNRSG